MEPDNGDPDRLLTLAVCLDSLPKFGESFAAEGKVSGWRRRGPFDLVIIDEVEQVLKHLMSDTIEQKAGLERCYDALAYEVTHAKAVVVLDADLGLLTAHAMRLWRPRDWESRCRIIYNEPVASAARRTMRLFKDRKRLEREVIDAIRSGQRCFITSNSKNFVNVMERMIRKECGEDVVMRVVTGDNSQEDSVINFVRNIKTEFLRVQVVLVTPSMGTGVDITFPNGECHVDRVFGFFYSMINAHTDIDQQLCRVRNPGAVDVWIDGATYNYTCNVEVVKDDLARAYVVKRAVKGRRDDGMVDYNRDDPLLMICAHVVALERASKNRLVELFCKLREANGWNIQRVGEKVKESAYDEVREELRQERAERLLSAAKLSDSDFIDLDMRLRAGGKLTEDEQASYEKYGFEHSVGVKLDTDIVALNVDGRLKERIVTLSELVSVWDKPDFGLIETLVRPTTQQEGRLQKMSVALMLGALTHIAGLTTSSGFKSELSVSTADLAEFTRVCRDNRTMIEEIFSEAMRSDFERKPVRQLNRFLARVGLSLDPTGTTKRCGIKVRHYSLDQDMVERMLRLTRSYLSVKERKEMEREEAAPKRKHSGRGQHAQQGTIENSPYIATDTGLLSLLPPRDGD
nr:MULTISPECIES: plasmid replication protein, CyRepA1 family [unclassified Bradyrhizobium]